ncbi:hypothetical protein BG004_000862 [Podila humilis]|nr:hypothetical protein BG004_000862 [Podila humilis]
MDFTIKDTSPLLNDSDTIVDIPMATTYTLFCVREFECAQSAFSVKVSSTDTVDELKKRVRTAVSPHFDGIPAHTLHLTAVSIPDDPSRELETVSAKSLDYSRTLRATEILGHIFEGDVPPSTIHIVVGITPATPAQKKIQKQMIMGLVLVGSLLLPAKAKAQKMHSRSKFLRQTLSMTSKKLVKAALSPNYNIFQAHTFQLTAVSIPDDPATERQAVNIKSLDYSRPLRATEVLGHVFEDVPPNTIHIVVGKMLQVAYGTGLMALAPTLTAISL